MKTESTPSFSDFSSETDPKLSLKGVVKTIKNIGNTAGKVANIAGKIATVAAVL